MITKYDEFVNEEIGKKTLMAGVLGAGLLVSPGCKNDKSVYSGGDWSDQGKEIKLDTPKKYPDRTADFYKAAAKKKMKETPKELPNKFKLEKELISLGTTMDIKDNIGNNLGKVEEEVFNLGKTFKYYNNVGKLIATARQEPISLFTEVKVFDENEHKIGSLEKEMFSTSFYSLYSIKDAHGNLIAKSEKTNFGVTIINIHDLKGNKLVRIEKAFLSLTPTYDISVYGDIDKRLIIFISGFLSSDDDDD